jgi:hypothetical protein
MNEQTKPHLSTEQFRLKARQALVLADAYCVVSQNFDCQNLYLQDRYQDRFVMERRGWDPSDQQYAAIIRYTDSDMHWFLQFGSTEEQAFENLFAAIRREIRTVENEARL